MRLIAYVPGTKSWRRRRHIVVCRETMVHVQEVADGELPPKTARIIEKHVEVCKGCSDEADGVAHLKQAIFRVGCEADPRVVSKLEDLARRLCSGEEL